MASLGKETSGDIQCDGAEVVSKEGAGPFSYNQEIHPSFSSTLTHTLTHSPARTTSSSEAGRSRTSRAPKAGYQPGFLFKLHPSPPCPPHTNQPASLPLELTCFPPKQRQPDVSTSNPWPTSQMALQPCLPYPISSPR